MTKHLALALAFAATAGWSAPATAQVPDDTLLVQALTSSSQTTRREAVAAAREIPPERRTPALQLALDQEFIRFVNETRDKPAPEGAPKDLNPPARGARGRGGRPPEPSSESKTEDAARVAAAEADYLLNLIEAVQPSTNAELIPSLLKVIETGSGATGALARFGDLAVPGLLALARGRPSGSQFTAVLITFRTMGERGVKLTGDQMSSVAGFLTAVVEAAHPTKARERAKEAEKNRPKADAKDKGGSRIPITAFDVATALEAGVALGDPNLRAVAEAIATDERTAQLYGGNASGATTLLIQRARNALALYAK